MTKIIIIGIHILISIILQHFYNKYKTASSAIPTPGKRNEQDFGINQYGKHFIIDD